MNESEDNKTHASPWNVLGKLLDRGSLFLIFLGTVVAIVGLAGQLPNPWRDLSFTDWKQIVVIILGVALVIAGLMRLLISALRGGTCPPWIGRVKKWGITVLSPQDKSQVQGGSFKIAGKYEKLPENLHLQLGILEQSGTRFYTRAASVEIKRDHKWESGDILIRKKKGNERTFIVVVMGKDGQAMFGYLHDVSRKVVGIYKEHAVPLERQEIPGSMTLTSDMVECERVHVIEK